MSDLFTPTGIPRSHSWIEKGFLVSDEGASTKCLLFDSDWSKFVDVSFEDGEVYLLAFAGIN